MSAVSEAIKRAERTAVAECIRIIRETSDGFLSPDYATGGALSSIMERFACKMCAEAIEDHFALGTLEQRELLASHPTQEDRSDGNRAALSEKGKGL